MASRQPQFSNRDLIDTTPLPDSIPKVKELGASSAPLLSASFFIGARCKDYNDDFMKCKTENPGKGEFECLKEGRRVTRCARSVIDDVNKHCLESFRAHWQCLDNNNQQLWQCRPDEWRLNKCVFHNLVGLPHEPHYIRPPSSPPLGLYAAGKVPVHLRSSQIYAHAPIPYQPSAKYEDAKSA
ncbi:hypothetical protein VPNG_02868 [Cytospora leucostoma]|uniref:CHCH domain-containing protein n=1 Tax=Cytospora leucostoma TaxID=1230097 RepID=A0A423XJD4_9PEZI|nr:hypothetical protein VPNG_02868 [Cytospora leucostoma]